VSPLSNRLQRLTRNEISCVANEFEKAETLLVGKIHSGRDLDANLDRADQET
jgi:hypothetical protein